MVTSTTPLLARLAPSKICALPQPPVCPPPWNQTITGRASSAVAAAVQMLRERQSSLRSRSPRV